MAKGKKSTGKHYTSKGQRPNMSRSLLKAVKLAMTPSEKMENIVDAYSKGKNPWVTVANPNTAEKNKPLIRVKTEDVWGPAKENVYKMKVS